MAFNIFDRVKETSTTAGSGIVTLDGASFGFQAFSDALSNGDTTHYVIENGPRWETGYGTYNSGTITRDQVFESSNNNQLVTLVGASKVFISYPASKSVYRNLNDQVVVQNSGIIFGDSTVQTTAADTSVGTQSGVAFFDTTNSVISNSIFVYDSGNQKLSLTGRQSITGTSTTSPVLEIQIPVSHTDNAFEVQTADTTIYARVTNSGDFSNKRNTSTSEAFGENARVTSNKAAAFGYDAIAGNSSAAFGTDALANSTGSVAVGWSSLADQNYTVSVGYGADSLQENSITVGAASRVNAGQYCNSIGYFNSITGTGILAIGYNLTETQNNTIIIGCDADDGYTSLYLGKGVDSTTPQNFSIHPTNQSGTDKNGVDMSLAAGVSTGSGIGGNLNFQYSPTGVSGTAQNSLQTAAYINGSNGAFYVGDYSFPTSDGTTNQIISTDGSGTLSFTDASASVSPADPSGAIQFNDGDSFGGSANLTWDDATLQVTGTSTTAPTLVAKLPASATDNAIEAQDSTGDTIFSVPPTPAAGKWAIDIRELYGQTLRLQTHYRSSNIIMGSTVLAGWTYSGVLGGSSGGGSCSRAHYFTTTISQTGNQEWRVGNNGVGLLGAINPNPTSVPTTALELGNVTSSVDSPSERTLMFGTCSSSATGNGRNDGTHLFLCTGDGAIAGTAAASDGGNIYVALGAGAGSGSGGDFIVRTLAGTDLLTVQHDGTVRGANGSGTDIAGANFTVAGGRGTGAGMGGHIVFQTAPSGITGSSLNSLQTVMEITDESEVIVSGVLQTNGVIESAYTATGDYSVLSSDENIFMDASSGHMTVNLPASPEAGRTYSFFRVDNTANSGIVSGNGNTIIGQTLQNLSNQYDSIIVISDGSNWFIK